MIVRLNVIQVYSLVGIRGITKDCHGDLSNILSYPFFTVITIDGILDLIRSGPRRDPQLYSLDLQREELGVYPTQCEVAAEEPKSWMAARAPHLYPALAFYSSILPKDLVMNLLHVVRPRGPNPRHPSIGPQSCHQVPSAPSSACYHTQLQAQQRQQASLCRPRASIHPGQSQQFLLGCA